MSADYPSPQDNVFRVLIGRLVYDDGEYVLTQEHHGAISVTNSENNFPWGL